MCASEGARLYYRPIIELWVKTAGVRTMLSWGSRPFSWSYCSHPDSLIQRVPPGLQGTGPRGTASEPAPSRRASSGSRLSPILAFAGARRRPARRVSSSPGAEKRGLRTSSTAAHTSCTVGAHSPASSHRWNLGAQTDPSDCLSYHPCPEANEFSQKSTFTQTRRISIRTRS